MPRVPRAATALLIAAGLFAAASATGETFIYYEDEMGLSANPIHELSMSDVRLNELIHASLWAPNYADQPQPMLVKDAKLDDAGRELTITQGRQVVGWTGDFGG